MANFFMSSLISKVAAELDVLIHNEVGLAWNSSKSEKKKLIGLLSILNPMLHEVEGKPTYSQAMLQWLQMSRNTADDAMILLDPASNSNNKAGTIKIISRKLEDLLKEKNTVFKIEETTTLAREQETDPSPPRSIIYERENAKEEIVKFLLDGTCHENVSFIPIVGIPGIGKTALAKLAFNDQRVKEHFEKSFMIWVWISDCLDIEKIVNEILESGLGILGDYSNFHAMKTTLQSRLHGKKFLLVIDNVCNSERGSWNELCDVLAGARHGSKVIVTTSNNRVAETMRTTMPYNVESLTGAVCGLIFESLAFQEGRNKNRIFQDIGSNIANKSKGVPRVAEDLGRLMMHKKDPAEWHDTEMREIWNLSEGNQILHMLRSSYKDLPSYAYRCFTYCSIFPRNYEIDKDMIIKYWIALDLILSEAQGREAIRHLFDRFFFVPLQTDEAGLALTFKLHELIYDLARYEMRTCFTRHFCNYVKTAPNVPKEVPNAQHLRTYSLLNSCQRCISEGPPPMMNELKLLRVLDMSYARDTSYMNSVAELHQLRFINLSGTDIENLPSSISRLSNLQSLILRNCSKLTELPNDTWKMHSLRHLDIEGCGSLYKMPPAIGQLKFLQTLPIFIVGRNGSTIGELGTLNLQGRLHIKHLGNVAKIAEVECANLEKKKRLTSLSLSWDDDNNRHLIGEAAVLNALQPHCYLSRLSIVGYKGRGFPDWLNTAYLQNLTEISLSNCSRCLHLPPLGELPCLKNLTIEGFDSVIHIGKSLYGERSDVVFPSLQKFTCSILICLTDWERESRELFPNLSIFVIKKCPKLTNIPRLCSVQNKLEYLEVEDCPHISSIQEINSLHALKTLKIIHCEGLIYLPQGLSNLSSLESLEIDSCLSLTCIPPKAFEGLRSLQYLSIQQCEKLTSVDGLNHLMSLRKLEIDGCPNLQSSKTGRERLEFLQFLAIRSCPELTFFPWGPLKHLQISNCCRIFEKSEWAKNLTLLESLKIENCNNLVDLPSEMKTMAALRKLQIIRCHDLTALPDWLTSLASLQYVDIKYCYFHRRMSDKLSKWCKERSRNWERTS